MQDNKKLRESSLKNSNSLLMEEIKQSLSAVLKEKLFGTKNDEIARAKAQEVLEFELTKTLKSYLDVSKIKVYLNSDGSCQVVLPLPHLIVFPPIKKVGEDEGIGETVIE